MAEPMTSSTAMEIYTHKIQHHTLTDTKKNFFNVKTYVNYWELKILSGRDAWKFLKSGILNISTNNEIVSVTQHVQTREIKLL